MPLSEHEQKMLDEMERQLFADDPRLARSFEASSRPRRDRRRIILGIVGTVLGLGILVLAVLLPAVWLGVLGFLVMLAGAIAAVTAPQPSTEDADTTSGGPAAAPSSAKSARPDFMRRMEERWEKRSGDDQRH